MATEMLAKYLVNVQQVFASQMTLILCVSTVNEAI